MDPDRWGDAMWYGFFMIAFSYPLQADSQTMQSAKNFFSALQDLLPCLMCKKNYRIHLQKLPLTDYVVSGQNNLLRWLADMRNLVNQSLGKRKESYQEIIGKYMKLYKDGGLTSKRCNPSGGSATTWILIFFILLGLAGLTYYNKYH